MKLRGLPPSKRKKADIFVSSLVEDEYDCESVGQGVIMGLEEVLDVQAGKRKHPISARKALKDL